MASKIAAIAGSGPGLGRCVARRFAQGGYNLVLLSRKTETTAPLKIEIEKDYGVKVQTIAVDVTDAQSVSTAFQQIRKDFGHPEVLVYNVGGNLQRGSILDITPENFEGTWKSVCFGAFLCSKEVLANMIKEKKGTILFTGATASKRGSAMFSSFAVGKFGTKALAESMAREFGPQGVHISHIVVDAGIATPGVKKMQPDRDINSLASPEALAEMYWYLHSQPPTAWTFELDVRPAVEKW